MDHGNILSPKKEKTKTEEEKRRGGLPLPGEFLYFMAAERIP